MRFRPGHGRWVWRATALAAAVLTLGIGLCLFDGVQGAAHHQGMGPDLSQDLCCGLLASGVPLTLLALEPTSAMVVESTVAVYVASFRGIDPPPKLLALS